MKQIQIEIQARQMDIQDIRKEISKKSKKSRHGNQPTQVNSL